MNYSYVLGVGNSIMELASQGFAIKTDGDHYTVAFSSEKSAIWEDFISNHLELGYWNEYLTENSVVFLFHLEHGIQRYVVSDFHNDEVLALCEKLCECRFGSLREMLTGNPYYREIIG